MKPLTPRHARAEFCLVAGIALYTFLTAIRTTFAASVPPLAADPRLQTSLTVRVTRMPLSDLLPRMGAALDVRLVAEGDDVGDQKIDLFTRDVPAAETLAALVNLLNAEGPKAYRWERSGTGPGYRYVLVRDLASRQWEARQAEEADQRLVRLLRARLPELGRAPFRPDPARPREVPAMRQLLAALSEVQVSRLVADRFLVLNPAVCEPSQRPLFLELLKQIGVSLEQRRPDTAAERRAQYGMPDKDPGARAEIFLVGDAPEYIVKVGVKAARMGGLSEVARVRDSAVPSAAANPSGSVAPPAPATPEPVFALAPRASWRMGDVLADLAARAHLNLVADDYTRTWTGLQRLRGAQPLSVWLAALRADGSCAVERDGTFLRVRNRRWWLDQRHEVPLRLLRRWAALIRGTAADRLRAAGEIARWAPLSPGYQPLQDRFRVLLESPELRDLAPELVNTVALAQTELLLYQSLTSAQQQAVTGPGLTLTPAEMPAAGRALFSQRVSSFLAPGLDAERLRQSTLFMRFSGDRLTLKWSLAGLVSPWNVERGLALSPTAAPAQLVGRPLPELQLAEPAGKSRRFRPSVPLLLYVAPAWPRPTVTRREEFPDLKALQQMSAAGPAARCLVLGTGATADELRAWWQERGLALPPLALLPDAAAALGVHHLPLALVVDRTGRIRWAKKGYEPGDEEEWRRQLLALDERQ